MAGYIHFTEEQKQRANQVDLVYFLQGQGETLIPSGRDKRLGSDHSITVRGSRWYDHAAEQGGYAIDLVKRLYGITFPEAVTMLLGGEQGTEYPQHQKHESEQRKPFALPEANHNMRRVYAYLMKQRMIDQKVLTEFAREKLLYEDKDYHNIVFVGTDENQVARHAHKKSTLTIGKGYRGNVEGSNPAYSFHYISKKPDARKLFVFEAPIDLLSYISLNQTDWKDHLYLALNGVSEKPVLKLLELYPNINQVVLGLDHDKAGIEASEKISDLLTANGVAVEYKWAMQKDWNEELKAKHGMISIPAEEHPQLVVLKQMYPELSDLLKLFKDFDITLEMIQRNFEKCSQSIEKRELELAKEYLKDLTALSIHATVREFDKAMQSQVIATVQNRIIHDFRAYQNRGTLEHKMSDISQCLKSLFLLKKKDLPHGDTSSAKAFEKLAEECLKAAVLNECLYLSEQQTVENNMEEGISLS